MESSENLNSNSPIQNENLNIPESQCNPNAAPPPPPPLEIPHESPTENLTLVNANEEDVNVLNEPKSPVTAVEQETSQEIHHKDADSSLGKNTGNDFPIVSLPSSDVLSESEMDLSPFDSQDHIRLDYSIFDAEFSILLDESYSGCFPHMVKDNVKFVDREGNEKTVFAVGVMSMAVDRAKEHKSFIHTFTNEEALKLHRLVDKSYRLNWVLNGRKVFKARDDVQLVDSGRWWCGTVSEVLVDATGVVYYHIDFTKKEGLEDQNFFIMYRVRAHMEQLPVPQNVSQDSRAVKMDKHFSKSMKNKRGSPGVSSCSGEKCQISIVGGLREVVIECVDTFQHLVSVFDFEEGKLYDVTTWCIEGFRGVSLRGPAVGNIITTASPPLLLARNEDSDNMEINESNLSEAAGVELAKRKDGKAGKKFKEENSDSISKQNKEHEVSIASECVKLVMAELQSIVDNQGGSINNNLANLHKEFERLCSQLVRHKHITNHNSENFLTTVRAHTQETVRMAYLLGSDESSPLYFPKRLQGLDESVKQLDSKLDLLMNKLNEPTTVKPLEKEDWPIIISPRRQDPKPQTGDDLNWADKFCEKVGGKVGRPEDLPKQVEDQLDEKDSTSQSNDSNNIAKLTLANSRFIASCNSILSSSSNIGDTKEDVGEVGARYRRVLSHNVDADGRDVAVLVDKVFCGTQDNIDITHHNLCAYGVIKPNKIGVGSTLQGVPLDELPQTLVKFVNNTLGSNDLTQSKRPLYPLVLRCLQFMFNEVQLMGDNLPIKLSTTPRHVYDKHSPLGPLQDLIKRNCEPIQSLLKYIHNRLSSFSESAILKAYWESLSKFQKYYNTALNRSRKRENAKAEVSSELTKQGNGMEQNEKGRKRRHLTLDPSRSSSSSGTSFGSSGDSLEEAKKLKAEKEELERSIARKKELEKKEAKRKESEKKEAEKRESEKKEAKKREAGKKEDEKREAEKKEAEEKESEKKEDEQREAEKKEAEKRKSEKKEAKRKEAERRKSEKKEAEQKEAKRKESEEVETNVEAEEARAQKKKDKKAAKRKKAIEDEVPTTKGDDSAAKTSNTEEAKKMKKKGKSKESSEESSETFEQLRRQLIETGVITEETSNEELMSLVESA